MSRNGMTPPEVCWDVLSSCPSQPLLKGSKITADLQTPWEMYRWGCEVCTHIRTQIGRRLVAEEQDGKGALDLDSHSPFAPPPNRSHPPFLLNRGKAVWFTTGGEAVSSEERWNSV